MKFHIQNWYPIGVSALLTIVIATKDVFAEKLGDLITQLADNALSISVTLLGFFLTILTIINSINTRRMRFVQDSGEFPTLMNYLKVSITLNLFLIAASFLIKYVDHRLSLQGYEYWSKNAFDFVYLFVFLWTMLASFRFTRIFVSLLTDPGTTQEK